MEEYEMTTRRRFTADFKARVALDALRGDKTIQEIVRWSHIVGQFGSEVKVYSVS
jgi:hypothetical protein